MAISQVFIEVIDVLTHLGRGKATSDAKIITRKSCLPFPKRPGRSCCQFPTQNPTVAPSVLQVNPGMLQEGQPLLNLNILTFLTASPTTQLPPGSRAAFHGHHVLPLLPKHPEFVLEFYPLGNPRMFSPSSLEIFLCFSPPL